MKKGDKIRKGGEEHVWAIEQEQDDHYILLRMQGFHPHRKVLLKVNSRDWVLIEESQQIDYKKLLIKYMAVNYALTGTAMFNGLTYASIRDPLTKAEWDELDNLAHEASHLI